MIERQVDIETPEGVTTTFVCHPERWWPHPPILFFMDAPGIREELRDMVRRLASVGYYLMLPNLYYRSGMFEPGPIVRDPSTGRSQITPCLEQLTVAGLMRDANALIAFLDTDPAAKSAAIGVVGYCMSARFAINLAAHRLDRIKAAASIYGTSLVSDEPDSLHIATRTAKAELYFALAEIDHWAPPEMVEALRKELSSNGANAELELYSGVEHGFAFPSRGAYDRDAAERHWERLFALFRRTLS